MSDLRKAAEQALEALDKQDAISGYPNYKKQRKALREALAQPEPEPLTDEALMALLPGAVRLPLGWKDFARAIERAHGIGGES